MEKFFSKPNAEKKRIFDEVRQNYSVWRDELYIMNKPFFMIHSDFKYQYLKDISGGALKLFIFLGMHSKYNTGESWYSVEEVSRFFDKDQRTIAKWFSELETIGLIFRAQDGFNRKANTFLKPYGFLFDLVSQEISITKNVSEDIEMSMDMDWKPVFGVIFNSNFKEYTFVLLYQDDTVYRCSCFLNFEYEELRLLRRNLKQKNILVDNFDIDVSIMNSGNVKLTIYNHLLKYFEEEQA